jgi:pimeloyl-ACP methyl ester carboxylesterase
MAEAREREEASMAESKQVRKVKTDVLEIAYEESGPAGALPAILLHGFPYDARCYDAVAPRVNAAGFRTIVPYLRGYGPTRFLSPETVRSGQQAALAHDLLALMDALDIAKAVVAGYDWGGRAACIVSALWPGRVQGLATGCGYNLQNIPASAKPAHPAQEHRHWYQYYFHTERGRAGLAANRHELSRLLWRLWSPMWDFDDATFEASAKSFDNPDFVDVVIQSYRHRYGYAAGDPAYDATEKKLEAQPAITVPTISLHGDADGVSPVESSVAHARHFTGRYDRRVVPTAGHNVPQETPEAFARAVIELCRG